MLPSAASKTGRREKISSAPALVSTVFVLAVLVRLIVWAQLQSLPLVRTPQLDSREYLDWASRLAAGDLGWPNPPPHGPGYPFFLGLLLRLSSGSLSAIRAAQVFLGAAHCAVIAWLGRRLFGALAGWVSGLCLTAWGVVVLTDVSVLAEALLLPLLTVAVLLCLGQRPATPLRLLSAGALIGLAALVRPTALVMLPLAAIALARGGKRPMRSVARAAAVIGAALIVLLPVLLANARTSGSLLLVQGHGGLNFYIGNSPYGTGLPTVRPRADWDRLETEAQRNGFKRPTDQDRYFFRKTFEEIRRSPVRFLRLLASKLVWTLQAEEIRETFSFAFFRQASPVLRWLPGFGIVFPLALLGMLSAARARPRPAMLFAWLGVGLLVCVALVTSSRYRLPVVPPIALFAGAGAAAFVDALRKERQRLVPAAIAVACGAILCHVWRHAPSHVLAEEWSATGLALVHERDLSSADQAFQRALREDPRWGPGWAGLGLVAFNRGDLQAAERFLGWSVTLHADDLEARLELGAVFEREGRFEEAESQYRRALAIAPEDVLPREGLARALLASGRLVDADAAAREVLARDPGNARAHLLLARILGARRLPGPGAEQAAAAAHLAPPDAETWFTLAMLRIDSGDLTEANAPLEQAIALGIDSRRADLARARLGQVRDRLKSSPSPRDGG